VTPPSALAALPGAIRDRLEELSRDLAAALGDDLVALIVHGSAARGEYRVDVSDVDLLVVVRHAGRELLAALANPLRLARSAARIESMILVESELAPAALLFPLLYDDIGRHHILLAGRDPFAGVVVSDVHRRLRLAQELREMQIRLRRVVVDTGGSPGFLASALERKVKQLRAPLRALLALAGQPPPDDQLGSVLAAAARRWAVDVTPLLTPARDVEAALAALGALLDRAVGETEAAP
jgi:predicted nucleotidyltransferase